MENMEKIILNDGTRDYEFELLDTFGVEDQEYAAMLGEDEQIYIMRLSFEDDEAIFETIDDKKEFDEILSLYIELLDEYQEEQ